MESADRAQLAAADTAGVSGTDARDELRQLRARNATLDDHPGKALVDNARLRASRDLWRERARAHRSTIRAHLDAEDTADAGDID